jgi:hypothetical protein
MLNHFHIFITLFFNISLTFFIRPISAAATPTGRPALPCRPMGKFQIPNFKLQVNSNSQFQNSQPTQLLKPQLPVAANDFSGAKPLAGGQSDTASLAVAYNCGFRSCVNLEFRIFGVWDLLEV